MSPDNSHNLNYTESIERAKKNHQISELNRKAYMGVTTNNLSLVMGSIHKGANLYSLEGDAIHPYNDDDNGMLHVAVKNNNLEITKYLLSLEKINIDAKNRKMETPLFFAVYNGNFEIINLLLVAGADIEARDDYEDTPVCWAAYTGNLEAIKFLISKTAKINITNRDNNTVLHWACYKGETEIVKYLIEEHGLDYNQVNSHGETPLMSAVENGHIETVLYLIELEKQKAVLLNQIEV